MPAPGRRAMTVVSALWSADDLATVTEVDSALVEVLAAKDRAIDAEDWPQVAELRGRERELLARWATLSRTTARPPGNPGDSGGGTAPLKLPVDLGGRLPDPARSSVILIGTADYDDPELANMPAVRHNLLDLADALTAPRLGGFDPARVHTLVNPNREVAGQIAELAEECTDTLLVYYTGHGLVGANGELHLGLPGTRRRREMYTALSYPELRWAVIESPARSKVVILDCCFSGRAVEWMSAEDGLAEGQIDVTGTYVLTATSATRPAYLPEGARNSAFTGALLDLLRNGSSDGGSLIRLSHVYSSLYRALTSRGLPAPQQRGTDSIGDLALTRNPSWPG